MQADPDLPEHLKVNVAAAISLFDTEIPEGERVKYALTAPWKMNMARDWAPGELIGSLYAFFAKGPQLSATFKDYEAFYNVCHVLIAGGHESATGLHPVLKSTLAFISTLSALQKDGPTEWKHVLVQSAVAARCNVAPWEPEPGDIGGIEATVPAD